MQSSLWNGYMMTHTARSPGLNCHSLKLATERDPGPVGREDDVATIIIIQQDDAEELIA